MADLLNVGAAPLRLRRFLEQADTLLHYTELLRDLRAFQHEQGALYTAVRDFFNMMVNADIDLAEVRRFINDWRTLTAGADGDGESPLG